MEKKMKWRRIVLPLALVIAALASLAHDLLAWQPHGSAGLLSGVVSLAVCIYAVVISIRSYRAEAWSGFVAAIFLLVFAFIVLWISEMIPFCPECDGGIDSALMRCIYAEYL